MCFHVETQYTLGNIVFFVSLSHEQSMFAYLVVISALSVFTIINPLFQEMTFSFLVPANKSSSTHSQSPLLNSSSYSTTSTTAVI